MINWIADNIGTICAALVLAAVVVLIAIKLIKDKKKGKSSCGCNCAHCAMAGQCKSRRETPYDSDTSLIL